MADGDVLLEVRDVSERLGNHQVLAKLTFDVRDRVRPGKVTGQLVALLGPSGVGKTRLLRLIAGLDRPDTGVVLGPKSQPIASGTVGVVFQNYILLRHRTVMGNLVTAGVANGMARGEARDKSSHLLERFGLADRGSYYPAQLSGGQRQRVAIAQQLVHQKTLLLMDEPFSGLDPAALDDVIKLIVEVAHMDELNTVIIVTHDIRAAMLVSDTLLMLGRDRAPDGKPIPGAHIQDSYNMVERGMAWRTDLELDPKFPALEREIKDRFRTL
ncbi:MAG TPA: ATP-binding cassette domain-containing protein [Kofleriaceae bacterium]|nr:ATP-binding cassette domain-containing protein [Kofleriaceae bacterium]